MMESSKSKLVILLFYHVISESLLSENFTTAPLNDSRNAQVGSAVINVSTNAVIRINGNESKSLFNVTPTASAESTSTNGISTHITIHPILQINNSAYAKAISTSSTTVASRMRTKTVAPNINSAGKNVVKTVRTNQSTPKTDSTLKVTATTVQKPKGGSERGDPDNDLMKLVEDEEAESGNGKDEELLGSSTEELPEMLASGSELSGEVPSGNQEFPFGEKPTERTSKNSKSDKTRTNKRLGGSNMPLMWQLIGQAKKISKSTATSVSPSFSVNQSDHVIRYDISRSSHNSTWTTPRHSSVHSTTKVVSTSKKKTKENRETANQTIDTDDFLVPTTRASEEKSPKNVTSNSIRITASSSHTTANGSVTSGDEGRLSRNTLECWSCSSILSFDCEKLDKIYGEPETVSERLIEMCASGYCGYFTWTTDYGYGYTMYHRTCAENKNTYCSEINILLEGINTTSMVQSCKVCSEPRCNESPRHTVSVTLLTALQILGYFHYEMTVL